MAELTRAYDFLLSILKQRENLIKQRLKDSLKHFGEQERILFESGDFNREHETLPDILRTLYRGTPTAIDRILGVGEQIENVKMWKNTAPEDKLYMWITGKLSFD